MKRVYGWKPDVPDQRDHLYASPRAPTALPKRIDLRPGCTHVEDQGALGSCTGQATAGAIEFLHKRATKRHGDFSRMFIYYQTRKIEGTVQHDGGAEIRNAIKACAKVGACKEYLYPYRPAHFKRAPAKAAVKDAERYRISEYRRVRGLFALRQALADGAPVVFGMSVYDSFESDEVAASGEVPLPGKKERLLGGHAVLAVGYDDDRQHVIVRNSWGVAWGDRGHCYLPYAYVKSADLTDDYWTITK